MATIYVQNERRFVSSYIVINSHVEIQWDPTKALPYGRLDRNEFSLRRGHVLTVIVIDAYLF